MADVFDKEKRSVIMKAVKSKNTLSTEMRLIQLFKDNHIVGWRRTYPLIGKPDFVFPTMRIVIFVDGCFWHGHDCRNVTPKDNADYWNKKREYNKKHDELMTKTLQEKNWTVIRLWECELKQKNIQIALDKLKVLLEQK